MAGPDIETINKVMWQIPNALCLIGSRAGDDRDFGRRRRRQKAGLKPGAGPLRRRVHPVPGMAGIEEVVENEPLDPGMIGEPFDRRSGSVGR